MRRASTPIRKRKQIGRRVAKGIGNSFSNLCGRSHFLLRRRANGRKAWQITYEIWNVIADYKSDSHALKSFSNLIALRLRLLKGCDSVSLMNFTEIQTTEYDCGLVQYSSARTDANILRDGFHDPLTGLLVAGEYNIDESVWTDVIMRNSDGEVAALNPKSLAGQDHATGVDSIHSTVEAMSNFIMLHKLLGNED